MGILKWTGKLFATGGISGLNPKSGVSAKGQRGRQNKQLKKQSELLREQNHLIQQQLDEQKSRERRD